MDATTAFAFILAMLAAGAALARARIVPEGAPETLNQIVLYVCLPASILLHAPKLSLDAAVVGVVLIPWLLLGASAALVWLAARALRLRDEATGVLLLAVPLGNTSFLGYPLVEALLGPHALPYAVLYDQFGSFLILTTFGLTVLAYYAHGAAPSARQMALRIVRFPPFLALLVALSVMPEQPPRAVAAVLTRLSDALLPLVTLAIGMQLKLRLPREDLAPLTLGLSGKLLLLPALAWFAASVLNLPRTMTEATVLEAAMPTMITAMALASSSGLAPRLAAALVGYGIACSLITLPLWVWLVR
jgi:hypothetical protein